MTSNRDGSADGQGPRERQGTSRQVAMPFEGIISAIAQKIHDELLLVLLVPILLLAGVLVYLVMVPGGWNDGAIPVLVGMIVLIVGITVLCGLAVWYRLRVSAEGRARDAASATAVRSVRRPPVEPNLAPWLAVLDLENVGGRREGDPFSFGVSSLLRRILERLPRRRFGVVPRSQVMGIESGRIPKSRIRKLTGAHFVLEGSLDPRVDPWIVSLTLNREVDPVSESWAAAWEGRFPVPRGSVQEEGKRIAEKVVEEFLTALGVEAAGTGELARYQRIIREFPTQRRDVFEAFNLGDFAQNRFNNLRQDNDYRQAEYQLNRALRSDPGFHDARAKLGFLYILRWETNSDRTLLRTSERTWKKILESAPQEPFALAELGYVSYVQASLDAVDAVRLARRAVDYDHEHAFANNILALLYLYLGYYEACTAIESVEVFKRAPGYVYPRTNAALGLQLRGAHTDALKMAQAALEIEGDAFVARLLLGAQHYYLGDPGEARRTWTAARTRGPECVAPIFDVVLAWIQAEEGDHDGARKVIEANGDAAWLRGPYGPYFISLCALAGEEDRALDLLEGEATFAGSYRYLLAEPTLQPLTESERFRSLLQRRYAEWRTNLEALEEGLLNRPDPLPMPDQFLARVNA